jgi:Peptidase inhibitor family I36
MSRRIKRIAIPTILGLLLASALPNTAGASAPWSAGCSGTANSEYLCIYRDRDFAGAFGHMAGSNASYSGETYPSSTYDVNDSISSNMNLYGSHDVVWYNGVNYSGTPFCVDQNTAVSWVGLFSNDAFSSHIVAVSGTC